ncbi:MAG: hypothetical protein KAV87_67770, partial [Desulfobacteraceae bacterium]|nr:hypothetical protein [Desulfobacteraceae bacterium]
MANKKSTDKYSFLLAFILGMVLMVIVYVLFESVPNRIKSGSPDSMDKETGQTYTGGTYTSIVQTAGAEDVSLSPSAFLGVEIISVNS